MIRKGLKPGFRFGLEGPQSSHYRRVLPFQRSWKVILLLLVLDAAFLLPAWGAFHQAAESWSQYEDLFDLVMAVYTSAWLLGWSIAPVLITAVLVVLLLGREVVRARPQQVELFIGVPGLGLIAVYDLSAMRNLSLQQAEEKSGHSWRESYLRFDYGANTVEFGSNLSASDADEIRQGIETGAGGKIRTGAAQPDELEHDWESPSPPASALHQVEPQLKSAQKHAAKPTARYWNSPSTLLLIAANLVPVIGAAFFGWKLADVMVLYWCESAIIGFFNLCKLVVVNRWLALFSGIFFVSHFGAFMAVHFLFIYSLFVQGPDFSSGGDLRQVALMFVALWPALLALFISHGYSFLVNFLGHQEFTDRPMKEQMFEPYKRIIFMHLVLIFGGGVSLVLGDTTPVLLLVIAIKIWLDVRAHIREHSPDLS